MDFADDSTTYDHVFLIRDDGGYLAPRTGPEALPVAPAPPGEAPLYLQTTRAFGSLKARHKDIFDFLVLVTDDLTGGHRRGTHNLHRAVREPEAFGTRRLRGVTTLSAGCLREQPVHGSRVVLHEFRDLRPAPGPPAAVTLYQAAFVLLTRDPERAVKEGTADLVNECRKAFEVLIYESTRKLVLMRTNLW